MDARLWTLVGGHRPETLKRPDLPKVAKAIVAYMRKLDIQVYAGQAHDTSYVAFVANKGLFTVVVRGDDWQKIMPYIQNDQLSPDASAASANLPWTNQTYDIDNIDVFDPQYYQKVLGVLNGLFPQDFPTSYL
jgi:hypothetical protein